MKEPLITIGIPVYNCESFIALAVRSVLDQTYKNFELIITDDGSKDKTVDILHHFDDPRIIIISDGENHGIVYRLNQQIKLAKGKYFVRMDGDDIMFPDRIERQVAFLETHKEVDVVGGSAVIIGDDNEILVKGKTVTSGYYNKPEATAAAFVDGWFRTGDAGKLIEGKHLMMTDRIKDLFKTSNGKYIAPQQIETKLGADRYIDQIAVIGNNRNYVTAIIAPNLDAVKALAEQHHITYERMEDLLENPIILKFYEDRIAEGQVEMASFEKIKRFRLIKKGFSMEAGELTSTLKLRRAVIQQNYKSLIDEMYDTVVAPVL